MRGMVDRVESRIPKVDESVMQAARSAEKSADEHARFLARIEALYVLEMHPPVDPAPVSDHLTIAAFNCERLKYPDMARRLLNQAGASIALLSEVDVGMARSGNRNTVETLAAPNQEGYVFGVEFVELDLGDENETRVHAGETNRGSLHGNAIVSAHALADPRLIRLEESGRWFAGRNGWQHRIGGRIAIVAQLEGAAVPLWVVSVHLESQSDPDDRAMQMRRLLDALDNLAPGAAMVIGGDFNTKALPRDAHGLAAVLEDPERFEPLFAHVRAAGFDWAFCNRPAATQRAGLLDEPDPPYGKLDWLLVRGVATANPRVIPALDENGLPISDHEIVCADISIGDRPR
jgi:endonuclease/exonuclease/phosphatase family metal-dependent hydrolase